MAQRNRTDDKVATPLGSLCVVDGNFQLYRGFYAQTIDLESPSGEPTKATFMFFKMLFKYIKAFNPDYMVIAFDWPRKDLYRSKLYPDYKANREMDEEVLASIIQQKERIIEIIKLLDIPIIRKKGFEADDVIATLVAKFKKQCKITIVGRDKDMDQVLEETVEMFDPLSEEFLYFDEVEGKRGYPVERAIEVQTLAGDSTDNIPGAKLIGPVKAFKLLEQFGSLEEVVKHKDEVPGKTGEYLRAFIDSGELEITKQLVTLSTEVPIAATLEDLRFEELDLDPARGLFEELGFTTWV